MVGCEDLEVLYAFKAKHETANVKQFKKGHLKDARQQKLIASLLKHNVSAHLAPDHLLKFLTESGCPPALVRTLATGIPDISKAHPEIAKGLEPPYNPKMTALNDEKLAAINEHLNDPAHKVTALNYIF